MRKIIQNAVLVLFGIVLSFVIVEGVLQISSLTMNVFKEMQNRSAMKNKGEYVILCLGESTTDGQWPPYLEEYLERSGIGIDFTVIDKGQISTRTAEIVYRLPKYLQEYSPDMVISMMGVNDPVGDYSAVKTVEEQSASYPFKTIKLLHLLYLHLREHLKSGNTADAEDTSAHPHGEYEERISELEEKIARDRYYSKAYFDLSAIYLKKGEVNKAEEIMLRALSVNPREVEIIIAVAEFYDSIGRTEKMHEYFQKACAIRPRVRPYAAYALALIKQADFIAAYDVLESAPAFLKEEAEFFMLQLTCLLGLNDLNAVRAKIDHFDAAFTKQNADSNELAEAYRQAGLVFFREKEYQYALFLFQRASEFDPENNRVYLDLCRAYKALGQLDEAEAAVKRSLRKEPTGAAYADYADIYFARGHYMKALDLLVPAASKWPHDPDIYFALSFTYLHLYEIDTLEERLLKSKDLFPREVLADPKRIELFMQCVSHLLEKEHVTRAENLMQVVAAIAPDSYDVRLLIAECYKEHKKYDQALDILHSLLKEEPRVITIFKLYEIPFLQRRYDEAIAVLEEGLSVFPKSSLLYGTLGETYLECGKDEKAEEAFRIALSLEPENKEILRTLAINFTEEELGKTALEYFAERYDNKGRLEPDQELKDLILGDVFLSRKEFASATKAYQEALYRPVDIDSTYAGLATSYLLQDKIEKAKHYYSLLNEHREEKYFKNVAFNYRKMARMLSERGTPLVAVQYPMRTVKQLKNMLQGFDEVLFVDNEMLFKERVFAEGYEFYFKDTFANDFGHCTQKGNKLLAKNIADVILREVFQYPKE